MTNTEALEKSAKRQRKGPPPHFAYRDAGEEIAADVPTASLIQLRFLEGAGVPVRYEVFDDEGHGFRKADTIKRSLEAELAFYGRVFGFQPAGDLAPLKIENME